ncbi:MAG: hypothetical protein JSU80_09315, partial [Deltaproteobacteria bacterium]
IIELMEYWNNGMMVLGAKNFIGSIRLHSRLIALNPLFQHSKNKNSSLVIYAFNDYIADKSRVLN